jgi:polyferredoxin
MKISSKRLLVQLTFFVVFNAAFLGAPLIPLFVPVFECFSMPYKTVLCNFGILQRNLSFEWQVSYVFPFASIALFIIIGALVGRAMCGWACPLGFYQDIVTSALRFLKKQQRELSAKIHYMLTSVKYMVLFVTLAIVVGVCLTYVLNGLLGRKYAFSLGICGRAPYCIVCPAPVLFSTVPALAGSALLGAPFPQLPWTFYIGFSVLIFFLVTSLITKRFWCRYICPVGALMSFFNKFSLLHISKKRDKCTTFCRGHERNCSKACSMGTQVSRDRDPSSNPECILCYECAESCSNDSIRCELR